MKTSDDQQSPVRVQRAVGLRGTVRCVRCGYLQHDMPLDRLNEYACGKNIMTALKRPAAVCASDLLDHDERIEMAALNGYRVKTYGDQKGTHAICKHGVIVPANADHHTCSWMLLVCNGPAPAR